MNDVALLRKEMYEIDEEIADAVARRIHLARYIEDVKSELGSTGEEDKHRDEVISLYEEIFTEQAAPKKAGRRIAETILEEGQQIVENGDSRI